MVYLKCLEGKACYDGRAAFKTWLFAVIRRTAADERRRAVLRRLRVTKFHERALDETHLREMRLKEAAERSDLPALLRGRLAQLPRRQQEVMELVFYHECSIQEAADIMRVSLGSARTHYERGKRALRVWATEERGLRDAI